MMRITTLAVTLLSAQLLAQGNPFGEPRAIAGARLFPSAVASMDVDLDGYPDVITSNGLAIDAAGPFEMILFDAKQNVRRSANARRNAEPGFMMHPVALTGRFDDDTLDDIVVFSDLGSMSAYKSRGPGPRPSLIPNLGEPAVLRRFETMRKRVAGLSRVRYHRVIAVDVDGDGVDEIAQSHSVVAFFETLERSGLTLIYNANDPKKVSETTLIDGDIRDFASGDFDGDGDEDFVAIQGTTHLVFAWNFGNRWTTTRQPVVQPQSPTRIQAADVDGDGRDEILLASGSATPTLWIHFLGAGTGSRLRRSVGLDEPAGTHVELIEAFDFDADEDIDIVVLTTTEKGVSKLITLTSTQAGLFRRSSTTTLAASIRLGDTPTYPSGMVVEDFDHDGDFDMLIGGALDKKTSRITNWLIPNTTNRGRGARKISTGGSTNATDRPTLSFGRRPQLGNEHFPVRLANVEAGRWAALLLDWRPMTIDIGGITLVAGMWNSFGTKTTSEGGSGYASFSFDVPTNPTMLDLTFRFQWVVEEPKAQNAFGVLVSDGWSLRVRK